MTSLTMDTHKLTNLPNALMLCGPIGSGKSTVAKLLTERLGWSHIAIDHFRHGHSYEEHTPHKLLIAHLSKCSEPIIIEATGAGRYYPSYLSHLRKNGYRIISVRLQCSYLSVKQRLVDRGHHLPCSVLSSYDYVQSTLDGKRYQLTLDTDLLTSNEQADRIIAIL